MFERAGFGPGADDEVDGLAVHAAGVRGIDCEAVIFRAAADDEAGDQTAAADDIDHREFFRDAGRRIVEAAARCR